VLAAKQRFVCLRHFLNPFAHTIDGGQQHLHLVRLHIQVPYLFHNTLVLFVVLLFVRFCFLSFGLEQQIHVLTLVIALVPDLRKRQHSRIPVVLQGALADVKQPAHITIVQPIRVLTLFPECLVAGLGKAEYLCPQLCPI
jgi:hypothetical protein